MKKTATHAAEHKAFQPEIFRRGVGVFRFAEGPRAERSAWAPSPRSAEG